jgi:ubiquinone biosynthesis protein COQ9
MTQDKSPNFVDTYNFLETQLNDVKTMGNGLNDVNNIIHIIINLLTNSFRLEI